MSARQAGLLLVALIGLGCGVDDASGSGTRAPASTDDALSPKPIAIVFDSLSATPKVGANGAYDDGVLYNGGIAKVRYDPTWYASFHKCPLKLDRFISGVQGIITAEDGTQTAFDAGNWARGAAIRLPATGSTMKLTFRVDCNELTSFTDDNHGDGYTFPLHPWRPVLVSWPEEGDPSISGPITAGSTLVVSYDQNRLTTCRAKLYDEPAYTIKAFAQFRKGDTDLATLRDYVTSTTLDADGIQVNDDRANFLVPADATKVSLSFLNADEDGCKAYDKGSYVFDIQ